MTDANRNTPSALGPVMANAGDGPSGKLRGMPVKLLQAVADLYIVSNELAGLPEGDWTQKMINTLQSSLTTIDEVCATPSTPWAQQLSRVCSDQRKFP